MSNMAARQHMQTVFRATAQHDHSYQITFI